MFTAIRRANLILNPKKCLLLQRATGFLEHVISVEGNSTHITMCLSQWPEAFMVTDQSTSTTARVQVDEMFGRFGTPEELHSY